MPARAPSRVELAEMPWSGPASVEYAVLLPPEYGAESRLPLCMFLMGGGGSRDNLAAMTPFFDELWASGALPPMVLATPSTGALSYYLDHPDGSARWETLAARDLVDHLRDKYALGRGQAMTAIAGISMGGYGALKIAFRYPDQFGAVAALQPLLEPGFRAGDIGARNQIHFVAGGPDVLIGPGRRPAVFESNNPANRARTNADAILASELAIYFEAGDDDVLNVQDGAEFLHRVLWELDISHDYHLVRGADHGGPSFLPRLRAAFTWLGTTLRAAPPASAISAEDRAVKEWIQGGLKGPPPPVDPNTHAFVAMLRAQLAPARDSAAKLDPTTLRRYGILPKAS